MIAFILHFIWLLSYIVINFTINVILSILFKNKIDYLKKNKNNYFYNLLFIFYFNKNLNLYKNLLSDSDINILEIERKKKWSNLHLIHVNINNAFSNKNKITKIKFKKNYLALKYINNNLSGLNKINTQLFSIYLLITKYYFTTAFKKFNLDSLIFLLLNRYSLSANNLNVYSLDLNKFYDYSKYIDLTSKNNNSLISYNNLNISTPLNNNLKLKTKNYIKLNYITLIENNYFYNLNINKHFNFNINLNDLFLNKLKNIYKISFSASNVVKYISDLSVNNSIILYLRKNKIFNKSRYSRNRQTYRTGAYWCLYINIIAVVAFYFWFYKFTMNFGYLWWLLYSFILSIFFARALKHRFYNPVNLFNEVYLGVKWLSSLFLIFLNLFNTLILNLINYLYLDIFLKFYQFSILNKFLIDKNLNLNFELLYVYQSFNWINNINTYVFKIINNFIK